MVKEQYTRLNEQVSPDEELLLDTISKANKIERKTHSRVYLFGKPVIALGAICLCFCLAMPVAAKVEPIYQLMYKVSPEIAQFFSAVQKSDEDNGIKMEVISSYIHDNTAEIYITMQDLTGDRIDDTTDLFDSYSINRSFGSSASCKRVGYDESTKTVTFLITIEQWDNQEISGETITFTVKEFLSHKQEFEDIKIPLSLSSVSQAKETQNPQHITGGSFYKEYGKENIVVLSPSSPMSEFPVEGIDLTGIAYIDGRLHIQTAVKDNYLYDNHGWMYFKDKDGNKIVSTASINFANHTDHSPGRIDYCDYIYDIPQNEISNYTLYGNFVTCNTLTKGNWKVTFPLESQNK